MLKLDFQKIKMINSPKIRFRITAIMMLALFCIFVLWAGFAPLAKGIVAPGTVVVDSRRKTIQHLEGGVVKAIHVREGSQVKENDILMELDDAKARSDRNTLRSRYLMRLAVLDRLMALQAGHPSLQFNRELLDIKGDAYVTELITTQQKMFQVLRREQEGKKLILMQRIEQFKQKIKGLEAYRLVTEKQISLLEKETDRLNGLLQKRLVESSAVMERQQLLNQQQGELGKTMSSISETNVAIGEAKLNLVQSEKEWQQEIAKQISETLESYVELRSQLEAAENVLKRAVIRAPQAGTVLGMKAHTIGGVIAPANPVMDIVPQGDKLVVEAHVRPLDIDSVQVGLPAQIRFSSFRAKTTPQLAAVVESISADAIADTVKGESYYLVRLSVKDREMSKLAGLAILPGMPAEVYVNAGSRTLLNYLFDPLTSVFRKAMRED